MKKYVILILTFVFILSLTGCRPQYRGPLEDFIYSNFSNENGNVQKIQITVGESAQQEILSILNSGNWEEGWLNCMWEYRFNAPGVSLAYCTSGAFMDDTNDLYMILNEADTAKVNQLFASAH